MPYELLQQPIRINRCLIPNRIVRTAHATGFCRGEISPRVIAYHEARARGGVGLSFLEIAAVHPSSPSGIIAFHDGVIAGYRKVADAIHAQGMRVFQQLWHGGSNANPLDGGPSWGPSAVPEALAGNTPIPMTPAMIDEVVAGFAAAARRCQQGSIDGVESICSRAGRTSRSSPASGRWLRSSAPRFSPSPTTPDCAPTRTSRSTRARS